MKRILICVARAWGGGVEEHSVALALALVRFGARVSLAADTRFGVDDNLEQLRAARVQLIRLPNLDRSARLARAARLLMSLGSTFRTQRFDVIVCNGTGASHLYWPLFLSSGGILLWHDHMCGAVVNEFPQTFKQPLLGRYPAPIRWAAQIARTVIVGSEKGARNLTDLQKIRRPIEIVPPLELPRFVPRARERSPEVQKLRLASFGLLSERKGIGALLRLWPRLEIGSSELHLFGPDPGSKFQLLATELHLDAVTFHGHYSRSNLPDLMSEIDIGLVTSFDEGYPLVAWEFMAFGIPFVITDVGAGRELCKDNPGAVLAPLSDEGVKQSIEDLVRRVRLGLVSRRELQERHRERFSLESATLEYRRIVLA